MGRLIKPCSMMFICVLIVIAVWFCYPCVVRCVISKPIKTSGHECHNNPIVVSQVSQNQNVVEEPSLWVETGQFGDTYGGFNALFTALALCGIGFAAWLQLKQLKLQRIEIHAQHFPIIEWNAPVARFLQGVGTRSGSFSWGAVFMVSINNTSREAAANVIIKYSIVDALGNELHNCACTVNGSVLGEKNLFDCISYACIGDQEKAVKIVDGLLGRNLRLKMEVHYMNLLGGAFVRKKEYILDVPSSTTQEFLRHMKTRLQSGLKNESVDDKVCRDFAHSLQEFVLSGKNTFVQEFAASISNNARLVCEPEDMALYENFYNDCMRIEELNRPFILGRYESSFGTSRYKEKGL